MATLKIPTIFTAIDKFSAPVRQMGASVSGFAAKTQVATAKAEMAFRRVTSPVRRLAGALGRLGLAVGGLFVVKEAFRVIADFETGLVGVGKTTGIADTKLQKLGLNIVELSKNLRVISSEKLLEFSQSAGQLGISGSENILKFAETMAKLETASDVAGEEGASSIARLLIITGEGVGVVDQFSSALVELGNTSAATENEILSVASEVGRGLAAFGTSSADVLGISAAFKSLDIAPEAAGTAVSKTFRQIEAATIKGGSKLQKFAEVMGVTSEEAKRLFKEDKTASFQKLVSGLGRINDSGGSVSQTLVDLGLGGDRMAKALAPMATKSDLLAEKIKASNEAFKENLALNQEFETASKTLNNALKSITIGFTNFMNTAANSENNSTLGILRDTLFFIGENIGTITNFIAKAVGAMILYRGAILLVRGALLAQKAISSALFFVDMVKYISATRGISAAMVLWQMAQNAVNVAMAANPIGLIIIGVIALIALIAVIINKWDEWGAALSILLGPLGLVISMVQSFRRNWDMIVDAFNNGGILAGIKAIAVVLLDSILMPLQQVLQIAAKLPGKLGKLAATGAAKIEAFRSDLGVDTGANARAVNPKKETQDALVQQVQSTQKQNVSIDINDNTGNASVASDNDFVPIVLNSTLPLTGL